MSYGIKIKEELTEAELKDVMRFLNAHIGDFGLWCENHYGPGYELVDKLRLVAEDVELSD